jgi:hypothetical protein
MLLPYCCLININESAKRMTDIPRREQDQHTEINHYFHPTLDGRLQPNLSWPEVSTKKT